MIAAAALRLVEAGRLALDAPCGPHPATLRQLLGHTAGVASYTDLPAYRDAVARGAPAWTRATLDAATAAVPAPFPPGGGWAYSNGGYVLVRGAVEAVTGGGLGDALRALVLDPLGAGTAWVATGPEGASGCPVLAASGYDPGHVHHGLICGDARAAVRVLDGIAGPDFLSESSRAAMRAGRPLGGAVPGRPWRRAAYGLGAMCGAMEGVGPVVGHSGGGPVSVAACYRGPRGTACAFAPGPSEAAAEWRVRALLAAPLLR